MAGIGLLPGPDGSGEALARLVEAAGYDVVVVDGARALPAGCDVVLLDARLVGARRAAIAAAKAGQAPRVLPVLAVIPEGGSASWDETALEALLETVDDVVRLPMGACELGARLRLALAARDVAPPRGRALRAACLGRLAGPLVAEIDTPVHYVGENLAFVADAFGRVVDLLDSLAEAAMEPHGLAAMAGELAAAIEDGELRFALEETPQAIEESRQGLDRLAAVTGALSRLTLPEAGGPLPVDIGEAVRDAVEVSRGIWRYVAEVEERVEADMPAVACDPGELRLALIALVLGSSRAIQAATGGRGSLGTIVIEVCREGSSLHLAVIDDGIGRGAADTAGSSAPDALDGLGWPLVRDFAARCGGCVDTVFGSDRGNTVLLVLPVLGHACLACGDR